MRNRILAFTAALFLLGINLFAQSVDAGRVPGKSDQKVEVRIVRAEQRVDIFIEGNLFTSYHHGLDYQNMPIFYPVYSPRGNIVNRGFPMREDIQDEARDHLHHKSLWVGYGSVNGINFWTIRLRPQDGPRISPKGIVAFSGGEEGRLEVIHEWIDPVGVTHLLERRKVTFGGGNSKRWMDHDITLTALERQVVFGDTKEGMFAFRVARSLEEGQGSARYINAYGWQTENEIWGKRAPWVALLGEVNREEMTIAIFDHPVTENHPSYWQVRSYGLFAANPLGRADYVPGAEPLNKTLRAHESLRLRYRIVFFSGRLTKADLDREYLEYAK